MVISNRLEADLEIIHKILARLCRMSLEATQIDTRSLLLYTYVILLALLDPSHSVYGRYSNAKSSRNFRNNNHRQPYYVGPRDVVRAVSDWLSIIRERTRLYHREDTSEQSSDGWTPVLGQRNTLVSEGRGVYRQSALI
jgi:hypothetical protein